MKATAQQLSPPERSLFLLESRAAVDAMKMIHPLVRASLAPRAAPADTLVIVVPGFGSGDRYTLPLRRFLERKGFQAEGWGAPT